MGISLSCSSCKSIDDKMNDSIFFPPMSTLNEIEQFYRYDDKHIFLNSSNNTKISVYISKPLKNVTKYIVWAHGNAMCIAHMIPYLQNIQNSLNVGFVAFDYQGYGCSEGLPSEQNCYDDIKIVITYINEQLNINLDDIYLIGGSLGTGIIIDYAYNNNWKNPLVIISPYKTIAKVVFDSSIVRPIDKFRSEAKIPYLTCPVRIIHGVQDKLINIDHGKHLYSLLQNKSLKPIWINDADHNNIYWHIQIDDIAEVLNYKKN